MFGIVKSVWLKRTVITSTLLASPLCSAFPNPETGTNLRVWDIAVQTDGKVLLAGDFTEVNGVARNRIARLNPNGSLDLSFNSSADNTVYDIALQPDGKIVLGGQFKMVAGQSRSGIARLNTNGSIDTTFAPGNGITSPSDGRIFSLALQPDGKILMGGDFSEIRGNARNNIARMNANGSVDQSFAVGTGANSFVNSIALQEDGKVLLAGGFTIVRGNARNRFARMNADSSVDQSFLIGTGANTFVRSVALQQDGKIVIGGNFTQVQNVARSRIARLNTNGSLDNSFTPDASGANALNNTTWKLAVQADDKILAAGFFSTPTPRIARFNTDGSIDTSFNPGTVPNQLRAVALQPNGKILIGGIFNSLNGTTRSNIARLYSDGELDDGSRERNELFCFAIRASNQKVFPVCLE